MFGDIFSLDIHSGNLKIGDMENLIAYFNEQRGRRLALARALGVTPGAISMWTHVPAERVVHVEKATGIPREKLRPDLFEAS